MCPILAFQKLLLVTHARWIKRLELVVKTGCGRRSCDLEFGARFPQSVDARLQIAKDNFAPGSMLVCLFAVGHALGSQKN
jgi:hypothetical protein